MTNTPKTDAPFTSPEDQNLGRMFAHACDLERENAELRYKLESILDLRENLRLADGCAPGQVLYVDRLFREAHALLAQSQPTKE